ncbi:MAG: hypothetical protein AAB214_08145 [Fibrobacterota bacterium]
MAKGNYNFQDHARATSDRASRPREETFAGRDLDPMMDMRRKPIRECLRVPPYESARPIMVSLDETGSMGGIPHFLVTSTDHGLPGMVKGLYPFLTHPQLAFCGVGDSRQSHRELAPLQVGHFEGEGHKMDEWLTKIYLEGAGGGNKGESYELPLYVAARRVRADAFRDGEKGYHFTIADEAIFDDVRALDVATWMDERIPGDIPTSDILAQMAPNWHTFFICPDPGRAERVERNWRRLLGDNAIISPSHEDISILICGLVGLTEGKLEDLDVFDRMMAQEFKREAKERARVIATLEAYASTRGAAGVARPSKSGEPKRRERASGNARV